MSVRTGLEKDLGLALRGRQRGLGAQQRARGVRQAAQPLLVLLARLLLLLRACSSHIKPSSANTGSTYALIGLATSAAQKN
jgi:hypothetical protein